MVTPAFLRLLDVRESDIGKCPKDGSQSNCCLSYRQFMKYPFRGESCSYKNLIWVMVVSAIGVARNCRLCGFLTLSISIIAFFAFLLEGCYDSLVSGCHSFHLTLVLFVGFFNCFLNSSSYHLVNIRALHHV